MLFINGCIALLAALAAGLFSWLFFNHYAERINRITQTYSQSTANRFSDMFMFVDIRKILAAYLATLVLLPLLLLSVTEEIALALMLFVVLAIAPHFVLKTLWQRRIKRFEHQLPDALLLMSGSLKAGASLSQAFANVAQNGEPPMSQEFSLYIRQRKLGVEMEQAMETMENRINLEDFSMLLSAVRISREVGGDLASTLDNLADTLRKKLTMEGKIESLTAQGKMQGIVMSVLPILLMLVLLKMQPKAMGMLFTTHIGWAVLGLICAMQLLGYLSIRKITNIDV